MSGFDAVSGEVFVETAELLPGVSLTVCNPLVHMNAEAAGDAAYARRLHHWFAARELVQAPVRLGRYPAGTWLDGETYRVLPQGSRPPRSPGADGAIEVDAPCLLVCRSGEWCWGHWLLDMLPKIVLAERCFPGRLRYAVPRGIIDRADRPAHAPDYARSVLESLAAYGIGPERLLGIRHDAAYRFASLFDVAGVSGKHMHPGLLALMRDLPALRQGGARAALTAMLRAPPSMRPLANAGEIRACLDRAGAGYLDPLQARFADQVAAFARSDMVVGDLGSNLAGMIYARPGTGLVTLAPLRWDDDYFAKLFQRLDLRVADIRGFSQAEDQAAVASTPYYVSPRAVLDGLVGVRASGAAVIPQVCGRPVAWTLGDAMLRVDFSASGNAGDFEQWGFSEAEAGGTWSTGPGCRLRLPLPQALRGGLMVEIEGAGLVGPPHLVSRPFRVSINGACLLDVAIGEGTILHTAVPADVLCGQELELVFDHPCCPSPASLGLSADTRPLGFMFAAIVLRRLPGAC